ncbi:hypothetical protein DMN91_000803 [Ooceraea biroi]|uniref:Uncharacterized protein n=1 Tax=Ooceraea biroi TaxID=2015173 RepID=A0A3L8E2S0_OOCBI|nr:hypothetical protein DMN91_000803 [Ooceraea biroi]
MDDDPVLHQKICHILKKYVNLYNTFLALRVLKERQNSIEFERKIKARLKNILRWTMKRENLYKGTLCNLENENKELKRRLNEMQQERDHAEAVNNAKVSKLQSELSYFRMQVTQLKNKYERDASMLQEKVSKDQKFENKSVEHTESTSFSHVEKDKLKIAEKHPAFMEKKEEKKKKRSLFKT